MFATGEFWQVLLLLAFGCPRHHGRRGHALANAEYTGVGCV
jgi:hypothetical protein